MFPYNISKKFRTAILQNSGNEPSTENNSFDTVSKEISLDLFH